MLFTKESDYAIRVIRALQDGGKKTIKELCELEQIPSAFGYKILEQIRIDRNTQRPKGRVSACKRYRRIYIV